MPTPATPDDDPKAKATAAFNALLSAVDKDKNIRLDYWMMGNALGSLIDYCFFISPDSWQNLNSVYQAKLNSPSFKKDIQGLWFDDYLWWAVGALELLYNFPDQEQRAYWGQIFQDCWSYAGPGTTVWEDAVRKYGNFQQYRPRFDGGIWNAEWTEKGPWQEWKPDKNEPGGGHYEDNCLYGIQNSVTNALRLIAAAKGMYFFPAVCGPAIKAQFGFFQSWFDKKLEADSLLYRFKDAQENELVLMNERVRVFAEGGRDAQCDYGFRWTGDQGLLLRGLIELTRTQFANEADVLPLAKQIIYGAANKLVQQNELQPWITDSRIPAGDSDDYISGTGVFLRHLWEAWRTVPALRDTIQKAGFDVVVQSMASKDPGPPPQDRSLLNVLTNNLAVQVAAYGMKS